MKHVKLPINLSKVSSEQELRTEMDRVVSDLFVLLHRRFEIEPSLTREYYVMREPPKNWEMWIAVGYAEDGAEQTLRELGLLNRNYFRLERARIEPLIEVMRQSEINRQMVEGIKRSNQ